MTDLSAAGSRSPMVEERRESEARFRRAYLDHYRAILAYALRRGVEYGAAEEIAAETFTVLWRRIGDAPDQAMLLPWLYGIAARTLANQRRSAARRERLAARLQALAPRTGESESYALDRLEVRAVTDALRRLTDGEQEVLLLSAWEGLSHSEIAAALGCSENAAAIRLHRARKRLTELCRKESPEGRHKEEEEGRTPPTCGTNEELR
jgi:RNA polymerase sigma-70 factor (ECF subfamily)